MNWRERWRWWRTRRRHHPPDEIHRAGELAEQRLAKLARAAGRPNGWHVFESVRIPDEEQGGKREIDLVIIGGNTLLVVEQKHWSGTFEINGDHEFIQHRKNGTTHNHSTVHERISRKARMLASMHHGLAPNETPPSVEVVLAFTNRNLTWPEEVQALEGRVLDEGGFIAMLEQEQPGELNQALYDTVAGFGTWDEVVLNGGLVRKGDVLDLGLGEHVHEWQAQRGVELIGTVHHQTGWRSLLSRTPSAINLAFDSHRLQAVLPSTATLKMHVVGHDSPENLEWATVANINLSKPDTTTPALDESVGAGLE